MVRIPHKRNIQLAIHISLCWFYKSNRLGCLEYEISDILVCKYQAFNMVCFLCILETKKLRHERFQVMSSCPIPCVSPTTPAKFCCPKFQESWVFGALTKLSQSLLTLKGSLYLSS